MFLEILSYAYFCFGCLLAIVENLHTAEAQIQSYLILYTLQRLDQKIPVFFSLCRICVCFFLTCDKKWFQKSMLSISWIQLVLLSWWETKNLSSFCELTKFPSWSTFESRKLLLIQTSYPTKAFSSNNGSSKAGKLIFSDLENNDILGRGYAVTYENSETWEMSRFLVVTEHLYSRGPVSTNGFKWVQMRTNKTNECKIVQIVQIVYVRLYDAFNAIKML